MFALMIGCLIPIHLGFFQLGRYQTIDTEY
jgi:hypothetical protein